MPSNANLKRKIFSRVFCLQKSDKSRGSHGSRCPSRLFPAWVLQLHIPLVKSNGLLALNSAFRLNLLDVSSRVKPEGISHTCKGGYNTRNVVSCFIFLRNRLYSLGGVRRCPCAPREGGRAPGAACPKGEGGWEEERQRWPGRRLFLWLRK